MKRTIMSAMLLALAAGTASAQQERVIATVNGDRITARDITQKLWWQYSAQGLSDLIDERLLIAEAARRKTGYDEKEAEKRFQTLAAGYKDKKDFEANLASVGWTEDDLKALIRRQMLIRNMVIAAKGITATDAEVKSFFEQNKARLGKSDAIKLRQIFTASRAAADELHLILETGADFAKLASLKSEDENLRKREGEVGEITRGMLVPEIEKEVFALKTGQYTKPVPTGGGFSIFKADSVKPGQPAKFNDALKADIKASLINQAVNQKMPELAAELRQGAKIEIFK